jgi:hypothetical protein
VSRRAGGFLRQLHAARPRADHADSLAVHVQAMLRPERGVMALPGEIVQETAVRQKVGCCCHKTSDHIDRQIQLGV